MPSSAFAKPVLATSVSRLKVLLIVEQCNPDGVSVPLVGYSFYQAIAQRAEVTLVTHGRNYSSLKQRHPDREIVYLFESERLRQYYQLAVRLSCFRGRVIWPLRLALAYPIYHSFNQQVYARFGRQIERGEYDIVHAITPMMPRYPVKAARACRSTSVVTPFVMGPVNGGVPYPDGFKSVAKREFAVLNFLRWVGRIVIPGYRETYQNADHVLVGSRYTADLLQRLFGLGDQRMTLFSENGLNQSFFQRPERVRSANGGDFNDKEFSDKEFSDGGFGDRGFGDKDLSNKEERIKRETAKVTLLFVGRLVPYKSADMLIESLSLLPEDILRRVKLTIVGDGAERRLLMRQAAELGLASRMRFVGAVEHEQTLEYYREADIFCFPSVREFGGAVVLEAMANGLPCIVVNHGGIGEYVTEATGFRIEPISRTFVVGQLAEKVTALVRSPAMRQEMAKQAVLRARAFTWEKKAERIIEIYRSVANREHRL